MYELELLPLELRKTALTKTFPAMGATLTSLLTAQSIDTTKVGVEGDKLYDTVELGRPENPSLYAGSKLFVWIEDNPETYGVMRSHQRNARINGRMVILVSGTGDTETVKISRIASLTLDWLSSGDLDLTNCRVELPESDRFQLRPVALGSDMDNPQFCLGCQIKFQVIKSE